MINNVRIAFSVCGEGHGHYGRNLQIIKELLSRFPKCKIDLYLYGDTMNIFLMDKELCKKVKIHEIKGFRFVYKNSGILSSILATALNLDNINVFLTIIKMNVFILLKRILSLFAGKKKNSFFSNYFHKYFKDFDFAVTDLEPWLPRVALLRDKPFLTFDNQHAMIYGDFDLKKFKFSEKLELLFVSTYLKTYHPTSDLSILTTFCEVPVKKKYQDEVKSVGPLIRNEITHHKTKIEYQDFILVYAHKYLREVLFPVLVQLEGYKFEVFTTDDFEEKNYPYKRKWINYHHIDPKKFIDKLVKCKAVISTAGNTLLSEALFLKKPFYAIGLEGQFEQRLNVSLLEKYKWGKGCNFSNVKVEKISEFLSNIDSYKKNLAKAKIEDHTGRIVNLISEKIKKDLGKN